MKSPIFKVVLEREKRSGVDVSDISVYICLIDIRSKSKEQLNERRAGLSSLGAHPSSQYMFPLKWKNQKMQIVFCLTAMKSRIWMLSLLSALIEKEPKRAKVDLMERHLSRN